MQGIIYVDIYLIADKDAKVKQLRVAATSRHEGDGVVGDIHRQGLSI